MRRRGERKEEEGKGREKVEKKGEWRRREVREEDVPSLRLSIPPSPSFLSTPFPSFFPSLSPSSLPRGIRKKKGELRIVFHK